MTNSRSEARKIILAAVERNWNAGPDALTDAILAAFTEPAAAMPGVPEREEIARAIQEADDAFGYNLRLTRLVDGESTYTLTMPGHEPVQVSEMDEGYAIIAERRNKCRADAIQNALETQGAHEGVIEAWQPIETAPKDGTIVDLWGEDLGRMTDCYWGRPSHECGEMGEYCDSDWHFETQESWVDGTFNERLSNTFITHWTLPPQPPALSPGKTVSAGVGDPPT